jgi:hypothetical protein
VQLVVVVHFVVLVRWRVVVRGRRVNARIAAVVARLKAGERVADHREGGNSMTPIIKHRQPVTLEPVDTDKLEKGDIVLVKVRGAVYTHLVLATRGDEVQIGNNHGHVNGWTKRSNVFGIVTEIDGVARSGAREKVTTR